MIHYLINQGRAATFKQIRDSLDITDIGSGYKSIKDVENDKERIADNAVEFLRSLQQTWSSLPF